MRRSRLPPEYHRAVVSLYRRLRLEALLTGGVIVLSMAQLVLPEPVGDFLIPVILALGFLALLNMVGLRCPRCRSRGMLRSGLNLLELPRFCPRCGLALSPVRPEPRAEHLSPEAFRVYLDSLHKTPFRMIPPLLLMVAWFGFALGYWAWGHGDRTREHLLLLLGILIGAVAGWWMNPDPRCPVCGASAPAWANHCPRCGVAFSPPPPP